MAGDIKIKYPSTSSTALTITLASLASSSTLVAGRASTHVDNTSNEDIDHLVSGKIRVGTSPTAGTVIQLWAYAPISMSSGTPSYGLVTGSDAAATWASVNQKMSGAIQIWGTSVDSTSDRDYFIPPISIADAFGQLPPFWGVFVTHSTAVNLNSTGSNHALHYQRIQRQYT